MSIAYAHFRFGVDAHNRGDLAAAERSYRSALRADQHLPEARMNMGALAELLARQLGTPPDPAAAARVEACYRAALYIDDELRDARDDQALLAHAYRISGGAAYTDLLERLGRGEEAIAYVQSLVGEHEELGFILDRLQQLLYGAGRFAEAIAANDAAFAAASARLAAGADSTDSRVQYEIFLGRQGAVAATRTVVASLADRAARDRTFAFEPCLAVGTFAFGQGGSVATLEEALDQGRQQLASGVVTRRKRLVTAMLVRDEIDIVGDIIACHLAQGVDLVLVTDNGSVDGSRDLLADLETKFPVQIVDEPAQNHEQALWMSRMVHLARDQHGAEWVIAADADEAWLGEEDDLPAAIARDAAFYGPETRLLLCQQAQIMPVREKTGEPGYRPGDERLVLSRPLHRLPETNPIALAYYRALHKCIFRTDGFVTLWHGNHFATFTGPTRHGYAQSVTLLHFPLRSRAQLQRKHARTFDAMQRNPTYDLVRDSYGPEIEPLFAAGTYPTPFLEAMRALGRLEESDVVARLRDRPPPARAPEDGDPQALRRHAESYIRAIDPYLPRAARFT